MALLSPSCATTREESALSLSVTEQSGSGEMNAVMTPKLTGDGVFYVVSENPKHPLVRYSDGQLSMSDSCAIKLENKLNRRIPPAHVNGLPIGFC